MTEHRVPSSRAPDWCQMSHSTDAYLLNSVFKNTTMSLVTLRPTQESTSGNLIDWTPCSPAHLLMEAAKTSHELIWADRVLLMNSTWPSSCIDHLLLNFTMSEYGLSGTGSLSWYFLAVSQKQRVRWKTPSPTKPLSEEGSRSPPGPRGTAYEAALLRPRAWGEAPH